MRSVTLQNITKTYGSDTVMQNLNLQVPQGKFFALLGPSGCGKTTLLRMIGGFEKPDSGKIFLGDQDITTMPVHKRNINTVFQSYALFPHFNVFENVAYSLRVRGYSQHEVEKRVLKTLQKFQLAPYMYKSVNQLSGGQQQRVAIARVVINEPDVLLLDEPLAALDLRLREQVLVELIELQDELKTTFIYITHDQTEALTVADKMAIMSPGGIIEQVDEPRKIYELPQSTFVARFVGTTNILQGHIQCKDHSCSVTIEGLPVLKAPIHGIPKSVSDGDVIFMSLRPEKIMISKKQHAGFANCLSGTVEAIVYHGRSTQYNVELTNGFILRVFSQNDEHYEKDVIDYDDQVFVHWHPHSCVLLAR